MKEDPSLYEKKGMFQIELNTIIRIFVHMNQHYNSFPAADQLLKLVKKVFGKYNGYYANYYAKLA